MKKLILLSFLLFPFSILKSQIDCSDSTKWAKEGTYEILRVEGAFENYTNFKYVFSTETLCLIEEHRHQTKNIDLQIDDYIIVRIYPKIQSVNKTK